VRDDAGEPVKDVEVSFEADDPTSYLEPRSDSTDAQGQARTWWRMGGTLGMQQLTAIISAPGVAPVHIAATATTASITAIAGGTKGGLCIIAEDEMLSCTAVPRLDQPNPANAPTVVLPGTRFVSVTSVATWGGRRSCAVTEAGRVWCWTPTGSQEIEGLEEVPGDYPRFVSVTGYSDGVRFAYCGLTQDGEAWCWGSTNLRGLLGVGDTDPRPNPTKVLTDQRFVQLSLRGGGGCGVTAVGEVWCWGDNVSQQILPTTDQSVPVPTLVASPVRFRAVARTFLDLTCAIAETNGLYCWGGKTNMIHGGSTEPIGAAPTAVPGFAEAMEIAQSYSLSVVLRQDGSTAYGLGQIHYWDAITSNLTETYLSALLQDILNRGGLDLICGHARGSSGVLCQSDYSMQLPMNFWSPTVSKNTIGSTPIPPVVGIPVK
jgi:hypothetical protein